ncbi:ROK family protein [Zavarzinia sp. CC-PAN008]|uniref:ROK family protein n=1 Tax=Zavarzinia sp. CC-PAN008 TaxID=3243332 RepID=UPI003F745487
MRFGIDLGGTKIELLALTPQGTEALRRRVATPAWDYPAIIRAIAELVAGAEAELRVCASVGVATPGAISPFSGLIKNANTTALNGNPLQEDLSTALGRPVRVANDADCFTLSEAIDGAATGGGTVFGVILGTGCGGGIVIDNRLLSGPNAICGEWGHNPLPWPDLGGPHPEYPGPPSFDGRNGTIESFISGTGLHDDYLLWTGEDVATPDIAERALAGEAAAQAALERHASRFARAIATVINILDPRVIVVGGGVSNIESIYARVPVLWRDWVFSDHVATRLVKAMHGDSSGVRGAAWLWPEGEGTALPD